MTTQLWITEVKEQKILIVVKMASCTEMFNSNLKQ